MKKFGGVVIVGIFVIVILVLFFTPRKSRFTSSPSDTNTYLDSVSLPTSTNVTLSAKRNSPTLISPHDLVESPTSAPKAVVAVNPLAITQPPTNAPLEFTTHPPEVVMENLRSVFRSYQSMFRDNPAGTNPEITRALDGGNRRQARFLQEEDGMRINSRGELIDPWGTPFFFHQLSGTQMEIHSAGPDTVMWTSDDLVTK